MGLPMTVNAKKWPDRLYALDVSRGVAALSVVIWHWQHFAYQGGALTKGFEQNTMPLFSLLQLFYEMGSWSSIFLLAIRVCIFLAL
jgi:peptidoglycan/LPS O-acetylase OafA/YrhL